MKMRLDVLTLFPEMFAGPFGASIVARAQQRGLVEIHLHDFRRFGLGRHRSVDDTPYGGGGGMILRPEPVYAELQACRQAGVEPYTVLLTPQGEVFSQRMAGEMAAKEHIILICGHYEGFDERIRLMADREISIGDYVLTGGELPAMVMIDAMVRLLPGALGDEEGAAKDSFVQDLLDFPQYTRPVEFKGARVPDVLLSGDHARIAAWRHREALLRTAAKRPDLVDPEALDDRDRAILAERDLLRKNDTKDRDKEKGGD